MTAARGPALKRLFIKSYGCQMNVYDSERMRDVLAPLGFTEGKPGKGHIDTGPGAATPPILGPALDGRNGTARIPDAPSADGWAHAQGPMQFLPSTWSTWGRLAPGRPPGASPSANNAWDAIWTAAAYLCGGHGRITDLRAAILTYNHSNAYVDAVLTKAAEYDAAAKAATTPAVSPGGMVCPVTAPIRHSNDWHAARSGGREHQGNDIFAPYGTVLVAVESGVVDKTTPIETGLGGITLWIRGASGTRWYYAHTSRLLVTKGAVVTAGQPVALLGNTGNARTTAPHLHFEMHPAGGAAVNPYPLVNQLCRSA